MDPGRRSQSSKMELPPEILVEIISYLHLKQAARLSLVEKRWRNLYQEMKNIVFRESDFVKVPLERKEEVTLLERFPFVHRMYQWISRFPGDSINRFEIYFPTPNGFQDSITPLVEFAVSKKVKTLVLDFAHPDDCDIHNRRTVIRLPGCVYYQTAIESLKLISCSVDCTKFKNSTVLRSLTIGHVELKNLTTLLSNFPSLETLRFIRCLSLDHDVMITLTRRLRELVFEDCVFSSSCYTLELPQVVIFQYSGTLPKFTFHGAVNESMQEAELDFWYEGGRANGTGVDLGKILNGVSTAKTLTIDNFVLQMIPYDEEELLPRFGTRHLVVKTNLHPYEFIGISLMIHKCPILESLTFDIVAEREMKKVLVPEEFNAETYWLDEVTQECLEKTLKVVVVKDFGDMYELQILSYLIKYGLVLERLDLIYMKEDQWPRVVMALQNVPRGSSRLQITLRQSETPLDVFFTF